MLLGIEHRGKHATGFVATTFENKVVMDKAPTAATDFIKERERIPRGAQTILLHTRWKTKGAVENAVNNHPVIYKTCFTIHNGNINNDDELFEEHKLTRNGEVDTEIIPALLDKHGMSEVEDIKKALEALKGPMAIASIDPVRNPNQLLLARGESSPLMIYHTQDYIVWASTAHSIREAWGKVFGTPPEYNKIGMLPEGKFWIVNGQKVGETEFTLNRRQYGNMRSLFDRPTKTSARSSRATRTQKNRNGGNTGGGLGRRLPWQGEDSLFITERAFLEKITDYRKTRAGSENVRLWSRRDEYENAEFEDVTSYISWIPCVCKEQVLSNDTRWHIKYGTVCFDCYEVITKEYRDQAEAADGVKRPTGGSEDAPDVRIYKLNDRDREGLDSWAKVDAKMNSLVIDEVSHLTDYDAETVEYLVWRMDDNPRTEYSKMLRKVKEDIQKVYKAVEVEMWEQHGNTLLGLDDEDDLDDQHVAYTVQKGHGVSELWFKCLLHQEDYRAGDECGRCTASKNGGRYSPRFACGDCGEGFPRYQVKWDTETNNYFCDECYEWYHKNDGTVFGGDSSCGVDYGPEQYASPDAKPLEGIVRCAKCSAFKHKDKDCRICEVAKKELKEAIALPAAKPVCHCKTTKGHTCKRPVKYIVDGKGYCHNHFNWCNQRRCNNGANHVLADGVRVCHSHSRNQKGSRSDKQLASSGIVITEVK